MKYLEYVNESSVHVYRDKTWRRESIKSLKTVSSNSAEKLYRERQEKMCQQI